MKKMILFGAIACVICAPVYASDGGIYADPEMQVTAEDFVTVERVAKPAEKPVCNKCNKCKKCDKCGKKVCGKPYERVVNREYFIRETVQTYKPVIYYEPAGTYTTMRAVDTPKCDTCNF